MQDKPRAGGRKMMGTEQGHISSDAASGEPAAPFPYLLGGTIEHPTDEVEKLMNALWDEYKEHRGRRARGEIEEMGP